MRVTGHKVLLIIELLLLLLPVTLFLAALVILSYPAYPLPDPAPIQVAFDMGVMLSTLGALAAWRLALGYLFKGRSGVRSPGSGWLLLATIAGGIGLLATVAAVEQFIRPGVADPRVGFGLLSPLLLLLPLCWHLYRLRGHARVSSLME